ncbi:flavin reductase family protein [Roseivirga echinicomitans]|uniref:Flavin reductase n=1 Tax=Roseivirga echinicomitans TaxID=296218 RepID=A0A150XJ68_9BACT|nr:flavin reductase family protein [Roseivirga echinicomitans]KYG78715.1 flavin reductase [Roseivirga echinicomitans]
MMRIDPKEIPTGKLHGLMLGTIGPRPIAFASTVDKTGNVNLSPFSFFNVFSANPPILVFSPARRVRDNTTKHTLENAIETKEVVINIVSYDIVEQMSLTSTEYAQGVNEFVKSGLTAVDSEMVKPPRVGESIAAYECKVNEVISLGDEGGAGNLIICEVVLMHLKEEILNEQGMPDPVKADLVGRMGADWYCRANGEALFELPKPNKNLGIGYDQIPEIIRNSVVLSGNNLGRLGNIEKLPDPEAVSAFGTRPEIEEVKLRFKNDPESLEYHLHTMAQDFLRSDELENAWLTLLQVN